VDAERNSSLFHPFHPPITLKSHTITPRETMYA
jgi:hypothetical protein